MPQPGDQLGHLVAGELAAFARLGALNNLDLELLCPDQVFRRDAKARRGDLLDAVIHSVPVGERGIVERVLATLARVGPGPDPVHRDRNGSVRLRREGTQRHGRRNEPAHDAFHRFNLFNRNWHARSEGEQIPRVGGSPLRHLR